MLTNRPARSTRQLLAGALLVVFTFAACSGAAPAPTGTPVPDASASPKASPTDVPGETPGGATSGPGNGIGGGSGGNTGGGFDPGGIVFPAPPGQIDQGLLGDVKYLTPTKDLISQRNVNVQLVRAAVEDGKAIADLRWYSGVAPCNQLDSVQIQKDDAAKTIHLIVVEGSGQGDMMCIEIAELHATAVDLGVLAAGTWTISAEGDAPAIKLEVG